MASKPIEKSQDILGYQLVERIGSGGFGEVWSATAPGGMKKALKIVYGYHDEKRAQAELKALDRVKEVRHPFLLSLERIEVFEGQLIVVSELADKSLADLFNEYIVKGEPGIPRDKLIKFMSNAAEALDYLADEFSLQHLDIKPENMLVVSGHVKVADFGLMKDLRAESQSLMQGMTPAYAAPELFDGQPTTRSDQYSLAIVYQEMLTGARPFPGTTPAQLAAQHMHGKPNLRPLPQNDQSTIARALAKDPGVRFSNCVDMIDELGKQRRIVKKTLKRTKVLRDSDGTESNTAILNNNKTRARDVTEMMSGGNLPFQPAEIRPIAPPECIDQDARCRPVLIVSVGSTANKISQKIKSNMRSQYGSMDALPSVKLVCIDSDRSDLTNLTMMDDDPMSNSEVIETPLKKPEDYRDATNTRLKWLGRRWIYNVPRTLQTEGLRPLGRLAFADHFQTICDRLEEAITELAKPENLARTSDTLEMAPGDIIQPRVYLVSSISGGIGSGMVLDLSYTIKLLLAEKGLNAENVSGILLHSSYQRLRDPGLSAANAFAFLTELRHFNDNGYPGDPTLGIPAFDEEPPFELTYFNDLGQDLNQSDFDHKLEEVAEYISLASTTPCSVFVDACRKFQEEEIEHFSLRTFGLSVSGPRAPAASKSAVNRLGRELVNRWVYGDCSSPTDNSASVEKLFKSHHLSEQTIVNGMQSQTDQYLETPFDDQVENVIDLIKSKPENLREDLFELLDSYYGRSIDRQDTAYVPPKLCERIEEFISTEAIKGGEELTQDIKKLLNKNTLVLCDINQIVEEVQSVFKNWSSLMSEKSKQLEETSLQTVGLICQLSASSKMTEEQLQLLSASINDLCAQRRDEFVARYSRQFVRVLSRCIESAKEISSELKRSLDYVATEFESEEMIEFETDEFDMDHLMGQSVHQDIDHQINAMEIQVYESLIKEVGGFQEALTAASCWQRQLPAEIRKAAQMILNDAYQKISIEDIITRNGVAPEQLVRWLNSKIQTAKPSISDCGGATRLMIGLPRRSTGTRLSDLVTNNFKLANKSIRGTTGNFVLCFEGEDLSLAAVAFRLLSARPDAVELVKRIHTRNDVNWSTLNELL